jgi:hypothetical protein
MDSSIAGLLELRLARQKMLNWSWVARLLWFSEFLGLFVHCLVGKTPTEDAISLLRVVRSQEEDG